MATRKDYEDLLPTLGRRARTVLETLLSSGEVSTYDLGKLGYDQPPRGAQDLKDAGVVLKTTNGRNPETGNRMVIYSIDYDAPIGTGMSERRAFPKDFTRKVKELHGNKCCIYRVVYPATVLQVDHRIPFSIAGDPEKLVVSEFMPLSPSANRSKSWACEHCPNMIEKNPETCKSCYWAYPDQNFSHIATVEERRLQIVWQGQEIATFEKIEIRAKKMGITVQSLIKRAFENE